MRENKQPIEISIYFVSDIQNLLQMYVVSFIIVFEQVSKLSHFSYVFHLLNVGQPYSSRPDFFYRQVSAVL